MRNYKLLSNFSSFLLAISFMAIFSSNAAVNIDKTRIIFSADSLAQSLSLSNDSDTPVMLQVWADAGDLNVSPEENKTPIVILPPVFKMSPHEIRSLRVLLASRKGLATDKESLYWLNIYQIPSITEAQKKTQKKMILPLRLRLKILIRPEKLPSPTTEDPKKLRFKKNGNVLQISNPTPWFMVLSIFTGGEYESIVASPKTSATMKVKDINSLGSKVSYKVINDDGSSTLYEARVE